MGDFRLSSKAETDLSDIADFTIKKFGIRQARIYRDELIDCFKSLSRNPGMGKRFQTKNIKGLFFFPFKAHSIFYQKEENTIYIIRILGSRMDFDKHL